MIIDLEELGELLKEVRSALSQSPRHDRILKTREAAALLRIGESELRDLVHAGNIPSWRGGNGFRFSELQLLEYVRTEAARTVRGLGDAA